MAFTFLKLYKVGKELNIDIPSGSANVTNTSKLIYHWNMVTKGGLFGGLDFKKGHKMPNVSAMDPILKELARLVTNSEKKRENNKKAQNEAEAVRKTERNNRSRAGSLRSVHLPLRDLCRADTRPGRRSPEVVELEGSATRKLIPVRAAPCRPDANLRARPPRPCGGRRRAATQPRG